MFNWTSNGSPEILKQKREERNGDEEAGEDTGGEEIRDK